MKNFNFLFLLILYSCSSSKNIDINSFYNKSYELISKDFNSKNIIVSDTIYFHKSAEFAKIGLYSVEMEKEVSRLNRQDNKNQFQPFRNSNLYKEIKYETPKNLDGKPIAFFSKPINDTLIIEVFKEYQRSYLIKDYKLIESKLFLLRKDGDSVKILKTLNIQR